MVLSTSDNFTELVIPAGKKNAMWVDYNLLCRISKITGSTKKNIKHRKKQNGWRFRGKQENTEVDIFSILPLYRENYGIPSDNETILARIEVVRAEMAADQVKSRNRAYDEDEAEQVTWAMKIAARNFPTYANRLKEQYKLPAEKCKEYGQRWAVMQEYVLPNYPDFKGNKLEIFSNGWMQLFPTQFKADSNTGHISFYNFYKRCLKEGTEHVVVNLKSVNKVPPRRPDVQMAFLTSLYSQSRKVKAAEAHRKLVAMCAERGEKPMSDSNVKIIFREFKNNIELFTARYGQTEAQKQLPYASLLPAAHRNSQWVADGWTLPFWGDKFQRYVLYIVRDNHSRKIIGHAVAESENTTLILEALDDAMSNTGMFPFEIVTDKHSFHKTQIAARLRHETEKMGATWTVTINAQRNAIAERYNQHLDTLCKDFADYTGQNITAKGKDARPSQEALTESGRSANWKTKDEIQAIAAYIVKEFNKATSKVLGKISPNDAYAASEDKHSFAICEEERIKLLRPIQEYKVTRGQINIIVGMKKHEFQLPAILINRYNNKHVLVAYEDLTQGIYLYDIKTGEPLGDVLPKQNIAGALADQTEADKKALLQLAGRTNGVKKKGQKAAEKIAAGLQANPEAIELLNTYALPKEIRQVAQQDNDLKRAMADKGINGNMLPIRKEQQPAATNSSMEKQLFVPKNHKPGMLSLEDIINYE